MNSVERTDFIKKILAHGESPWQDNSVWHEALDRAARHSMVTLQGDWATLFLTHESLPVELHPKVTRSGDRWLKSVVVDRNGHLVSVGLPHFFSGDQWSVGSGWSWYEKLDGTCILISRLSPTEFLIRSRRRIYGVGSLKALALPGSDTGGLAKWIDGLPTGTTVSAEAIVPWERSDLPQFLTRATQVSGFVPYVRYPAPRLVVTNMVVPDGSTFRLGRQSDLDAAGAEYGFARPERAPFSTECDAQRWLARAEEAEGWCVYYDDDQQVIKCKSHWYRRVHGVVNRLHGLLS